MPPEKRQVRPGRWRRIALFLAVMGPGLITASVDNDAGGITTYSLAGAQFGTKLLWTLGPITVALIVVQEMSARMGVVTGKGLADLIRENFGVRTTFWVSVALVIANLANTIAEFAGVAASLADLPGPALGLGAPGGGGRLVPGAEGERTGWWRRSSWWRACSTSPTPSRWCSRSRTGARWRWRR